MTLQYDKDSLSKMGDEGRKIDGGLKIRGNSGLSCLEF
jgi:hypothetical protein